MKKHTNKFSITIILIMILIINININVFAADMDVTVTLENNTLTFKETINSWVNFENLAPGDKIDYTIKIKNETSKDVNLYFIEATEDILFQQLEKITLEIYLNGNFYLDGNISNIVEEYMYSLTQYEEIDIIIRVGLSKFAGNEFINKKFNITWKIGVKGSSDEDIDLDVIEKIEEGNKEHTNNEGGNVTLIPKAGEDRRIYYVLYTLIALIVIYIIIILVKKDKKEEQEDIDINSNEGVCNGEKEHIEKDKKNS